MNKAELIRSISTGAGVSQATATKMLTSMKEAIENAITHGEKVAVRGFGTFSVSDHSARRCRHPITGEVMQAKAYRTVRFTPSAEIKSNLN